MNRQPGDRRPRSGKVQQLRLESGGLIASLAVLLVLTALIVTCASCRLYDAGHSDRTSDLPSGEAPAASEQVDLSSGGDEKPEANIEYLSLSEKDLRTGDLILVNRVHLYDAANAAGDATTVRDGRLTDIQENAFQLPIGEQILAALEEMQKGMVAAMNDGVRLLVNAGYRTAEVQQGLIDSFTESKGEEYVRQYVAPVGASEHHTPYAADISFYDTTGKKVLATTSVDAAAYYSWCLLNCKNYGLILRYTADQDRHHRLQRGKLAFPLRRRAARKLYLCARSCAGGIYRAAEGNLLQQPPVYYRRRRPLLERSIISPQRTALPGLRTFLFRSSKNTPFPVTTPTATS